MMISSALKTLEVWQVIKIESESNILHLLCSIIIGIDIFQK